MVIGYGRLGASSLGCSSLLNRMTGIGFRRRRAMLITGAHSWGDLSASGSFCRAASAGGRCWGWRWRARCLVGVAAFRLRSRNFWKWCGFPDGGIFQPALGAAVGQWRVPARRMTAISILVRAFSVVGRRCWRRCRCFVGVLVLVAGSGGGGAGAGGRCRCPLCGCCVQLSYCW